MNRQTTIVLVWLVAAMGCTFVEWEPAPAPSIPLPPPPKDSIEQTREDDFGDDDDDDEKEEAALIPRRVLFGNPNRTGLRLSHDGKKLAYLAPEAGVLNVWVAPVDDLDAAKVITHSTSRPIRTFFWAYNNDQILYLQDKGGDENWRVYSVNVADGKELDLTPLEGVKAQIQGRSHRKPDEILVELNDRDKRFHDVHRVNTRTGARQLVQQNDAEYSGFIVDEDLNVRFANKPTDDGGEKILVLQGGKFVPFIDIAAEDQLTTYVVGFDKSGKHILMVDSRGRNTAALTSLAAQVGSQSKLVADDAQSDVEDFLLHPTENTVQAVASNYLRKRWQFMDTKVEADFAELSRVTRGDVEITSRTLDDRKWTVAFLTDDGPVRYYLFDRDTKKATFLFSNREELEGMKLAKMRPVEIPSRAGRSLVMAAGSVR